MRPHARLLIVSLCGALAAVGSPPVAGLEEAPKVEVGKSAPSFDLPATQISKVLPDKKDAKTIQLKDFANKKNVVLFFFPKAMTRG